MFKRKTVLLAVGICVICLIIGAAYLLSETAALRRLHRAVEAGDAEKTERILADFEADVNYYYSNPTMGTLGRTALELACEREELEIAQMLLESGANPNAGGWGTLSIVLIRDYPRKREMVELLLEAGADISAEGKSLPDAVSSLLSFRYNSDFFGGTELLEEMRGDEETYQILLLLAEHDSDLFEEVLMKVSEKEKEAVAAYLPENMAFGRYGR